MDPSQQHNAKPADFHTTVSNTNELARRTASACLYANARSMGNKQEELETCARLQGYDLIGITEMWWDGSYDWTFGMEEYMLFRKDRQGR